MNVDLFIDQPLSLSLYNSSPPIAPPRPSQSSHASSVSLTSPLFSLPKHHKRLSISIMTACVDTSQLSQDPNRPPNGEHSYKYVNNFRPNFPDRVSDTPFTKNQVNSVHTQTNFEVDEERVYEEDRDYDIWIELQDEARSDIEQEPILSSYYFGSVLSHKSLESALASHLSMKLSSLSLQSGTLFDIFMGVMVENQDIIEAVKADLRAVKERDPACTGYLQCFLNFKGFLACQAQRIAHKLWSQGRKALALVIQNRVSEVFAVDIHPGAIIGNGVMFDHATGVVIGETAVIGDNVSILHQVTLGGTGKLTGDRHPKIGNGVLIGAGTCILGNIKIGDGAKIGACSVVLKEVPPRTTAVGNPAKLIGGKENPIKLDKIPSFTMDHTSHIHEWSDYVI